MVKSVTLNQVGYLIDGVAMIKDWFGREGEIEMTSYEVNELTDEKILDGLNDSRFGVESIIGAVVNVFELYENDYVEFIETRVYDEKQTKGKGRLGI